MHPPYYGVPGESPIDEETEAEEAARLDAEAEAQEWAEREETDRYETAAAERRQAAAHPLDAPAARLVTDLWINDEERRHD